MKGHRPQGWVWVVRVVTGVVALAGARAAAETGGRGAAEPSLALVVAADATGVDPEAVRRAVEQELGVPVRIVGENEAPPRVRAQLRVEIRAARGELAMTFEEDGREPVARIVPLPPTPSAIVANIAWLAGNLARDEAGELLATPPREAPSPSAPASSPPLATATAPAPATALVTATDQPPASLVAAASSPAQDRRPFAPVTVSAFYPLATNYRLPQVRTRLSLNLIHGRVGLLEGFQLGGANQVDDGVLGGQVGFLFNTTGGTVRGFQAAALGSVARGDLHGFQVSGIANVVGGRAEGFQMALVNHAGQGVDGFQGGVVNVAGDVRGLQIGLVNVARTVRGVQLALVNVADDVEGVPIGLVSVSKSGGVHPVFWTSSTADLNVGVKFSTRYTYTQFSGARHVERGIEMGGPGFALGVRVPASRLAFESDLGGLYLFGGPLYGVSREQGLADDVAIGHLRGRLTLELHRHLSLFAGLGLAVRARFYQTPTDATAFGAALGRDEVTFETLPDLFGGVQL